MNYDHIYPFMGTSTFPERVAKSWVVQSDGTKRATFQQMFSVLGKYGHIMDDRQWLNELTAVLRSYFAVICQTDLDAFYPIYKEYLLKNIRLSSALSVCHGLEKQQVLEMSASDFDFLVSDKLWSYADKTRARKCITSAIGGGLDYLGLSRFELPVEHVAGVIAYFVDPINYLVACSFCDGMEWAENITSGTSQPVTAKVLYAFVIQIRGGFKDVIDHRHSEIVRRLSSVSDIEIKDEGFPLGK